jgi:hypothetical protein
VAHARRLARDVVHVVVVVRELHFLEAARFALAVKVGQHRRAQHALRGVTTMAAAQNQRGAFAILPNKEKNIAVADQRVKKKNKVIKKQQ